MPLTVGELSRSDIGEGMAKVMVPIIKPAEARDTTVPCIVPFGPFMWRVVPATSMLEASSAVKARPAAVNALSVLADWRCTVEDPIASADLLSDMVIPWKFIAELETLRVVSPITKSPFSKLVSV